MCKQQFLDMSDLATFFFRFANISYRYDPNCNKLLYLFQTFVHFRRVKKGGEGVGIMLELNGTSPYVAIFRKSYFALYKDCFLLVLDTAV